MYALNEGNQIRVRARKILQVSLTFNQQKIICCFEDPEVLEVPFWMALGTDSTLEIATLSVHLESVFSVSHIGSLASVTADLSAALLLRCTN